MAGRTIVVTRSREQASELSRRLQTLGANVIEIPTIAIVPPHSYEPMDAALRELDRFDWLIVTSANTARVIAERRAALQLTLPYQPRTVAVGPATAAALERIGLRVDLVPEPAVAESIIAALAHQVNGKRVLLARAEVARDILPEALAKAGALVTIVEAYRTVLAAGSHKLVAEAFAPETPIDALTFTSSSTVINLFALMQLEGVDWPSAARAFSIGPITSATLRERGIEPHLEATEHDIEGLVAAVVQGLSGAPRKP